MSNSIVHAPSRLFITLRLSCFVLTGGWIVGMSSGCGKKNGSVREQPPPTALESQMASPPADGPRTLQELIDKLTADIAAADKELTAVSEVMPAGGVRSEQDERQIARLGRRIEKLENEWAGIQRMNAQLEGLRQEGVGEPDMAACRAALDRLQQEWKDRFSQITGVRDGP